MKGFQFALEIFIVFSVPIFVQGTEQIQPVGYLRSELFAPRPLSPNGVENITSSLFNVSDAPLLLDITKYHYQPVFLTVTLVGQDLATGFDDTWGPKLGAFLNFDREKLLVSGIGARGERPIWPMRPGIILLKDEGYARVLTFLPGWLGAAKFPQNTRNLVLDMSPTIKVSLPLLTPDAVTPGKPIVFDSPHKVFAPGARIVAFTRISAISPQIQPIPVIKDFELHAGIEMTEPITAGQDVVVTYLIGNTGSKSLWIWQNSLVPACVEWQLMKGDVLITTINNKALQALRDLLPLRSPIPLNPGEYLAFRQVLVASSLPLKRDNKYQLRLHINIPWDTTEPKEQNNPENSALSALIELNP